MWDVRALCSLPSPRPCHEPGFRYETSHRHSVTSHRHPGTLSRVSATSQGHPVMLLHRISDHTPFARSLSAVVSHCSDAAC
eukprot:2027422-Rhodomonas_salina.4